MTGNVSIKCSQSDGNYTMNCRCNQTLIIHNRQELSSEMRIGNLTFRLMYDKNIPIQGGRINEREEYCIK